MANPDPREATQAAAAKRKALKELQDRLAALGNEPKFVESEELDGLRDDLIELQSRIARNPDSALHESMTEELAALNMRVVRRAIEEKTAWDNERAVRDAARSKERAELERSIVRLLEPVDHNETRRLRRAHERMKRVTSAVQAEIDAGHLRLYGPFGEERWFVVLTKEEYDDGVRVDSEGFIDEPSTAEFRAKYYPEEWAEQQEWDEKFAFLSTSLDTNVRESRRRAERLADAEDDLIVAETHTVVRNLHDEPEDIARRERVHDAQVVRLRGRVADCRRAFDTADEALKEARRRLDLFTSQNVFIGVFRGRLVNEER